VNIEQIQRITRWADRAASSIVHPFPVRNGSGGVKPGARLGEPSSRNRDDPPGPQSLPEPLRDSEICVLPYLPANLAVPEIADELYVSHDPRNSCATFTPSPACTAGARPCSVPAPWACPHPPRASADSFLADKIGTKNRKPFCARELAGNHPDDAIPDHPGRE
jgi:hypothetical protein